MFAQKKSFLLFFCDAVDHVQNARAIQAVIHLLAAFVVGYDPGIAQDGQVLTDGGEFHPDRIDELAHAVFRAIGKLPDDPQAYGMPQRLEHFGFPPAAIFLVNQHIYIVI